MYEPWFPKNHLIQGDLSLKNILFYGDEYQIYVLSDTRTVLIATRNLAQAWCKAGVLPATALSEMNYGSEKYSYLISDVGYRLEPVSAVSSFNELNEALAFALSIRESRQCLGKTISLHDGIYVEMYSRVLPVYSEATYVADDVVLGSCLTGGVSVSVQSTERVSQLVGWMDRDDIERIGNAACIGVSSVTEESIGLTESDEEVDEQIQAEVTSQKKIKRKKSTENQSSSEKAYFHLPGRKDLEILFNDFIIDVIRHADRYESMGITFPAPIVLSGPPGCGKTYAVEKLVEFLGWPCYQINSDSIGSSLIHETGKKIAAVFDEAIKNAPSVIVIDEMESYLSNRADSGLAIHHVEEVSEFLRKIPQAIQNHVLIFGMTNLIEMIDPAIIRRGRFDRIVEVELPDKSDIHELLSSELKKLPVSDKVNLDRITDSLVGHPISDVSFVIRESGRLAAKAKKDEIDDECFRQALKSLPKNSQKKQGIGFVIDTEE